MSICLCRFELVVCSQNQWLFTISSPVLEALLVLTFGSNYPCGSAFFEYSFFTVSSGVFIVGVQVGRGNVQSIVKSGNSKCFSLHRLGSIVWLKMHLLLPGVWALFYHFQDNVFLIAEDK